jgi:ABC-2 type transport system ATP-binding protein
VTVVEVADQQGDDADRTGQALLQAALAAGPVHAFGPVRPHLVELYRHAVSDPTDPTDPQPGAARDLQEARP